MTADRAFGSDDKRKPAAATRNPPRFPEQAPDLPARWQKAQTRVKPCERRSRTDLLVWLVEEKG